MSYLTRGPMGGVTGDDVRRLVAALPEAEERETWGHPTFRVRDKMFAAMAQDGTSMSVKALPEELRELITEAWRRTAPSAWCARSTLARLRPVLSRTGVRSA